MNNVMNNVAIPEAAIHGKTISEYSPVSYGE